MSDVEARARYDAELSNTKLSESQLSAIWNTFSLEELTVENMIYSVNCRCGGSYIVQEEDIKSAQQEGEEEILVECDTCSLSILLTLT